jgi:hypothetical protein
MNAGIARFLIADDMRSTTEIAKANFVSVEQLGLTMIRESPLHRLNFDLLTMCKTIAALFE